MISMSAANHALYYLSGWRPIVDGGQLLTVGFRQDVKDKGRTGRHLLSYVLALFPSHRQTVRLSDPLTFLPSHRLTVLPSYRLTFSPFSPSHRLTLKPSGRSAAPSHRLTLFSCYLPTASRHLPTFSPSYRQTV